VATLLEQRHCRGRAFSVTAVDSNRTITWNGQIVVGQVTCLAVQRFWQVTDTPLVRLPYVQDYQLLSSCQATPKLAHRQLRSPLDR
jgi:hypothetical protein